MISLAWLGSSRVDDGIQARRTIVVACDQNPPGRGIPAPPSSGPARLPAPSALELTWYLADAMARATNFGDPSYEPTDEELAELMHEAFAEVPARNAAGLAQIRREIAELRKLALARLEQRLSSLK